MIKLIYPIDPTIPRIRRHAERLSHCLPVPSKRVVLQPNEASKSLAHQEIAISGDCDLLVFMGHGRSDALYGAKGKYYNSVGFIDECAMDDIAYFYNDDSFIDADTYGLFTGKKVLCFACKSGELGEKLVNAGAKVVLGFGLLPTTREEFENDWNEKGINNRAIDAMAGIFDVSFCRALCRTVFRGGNFADLLFCIKNEIHSHIAMLLYSKARFRYQLANVLYEVEKSVTVSGDSRLPLV